MHFDDVAVAVLDLRDDELPTSNRERANHVLAFAVAAPETGEVLVEGSTELTDKLRQAIRWEMAK